MPFYPGVGVGGHCIPVDPYYLTERAKEFGATSNLISLALETNEEVPAKIATQIVKLLVGINNRVKRVLVLGIAFKRDVSDTRESPAVELLEILQSWGADACYNDPYVLRITNHKTLDKESVELTDELLESADCVVIATDHSCYDWKRIVDKARMIFDTRNATKGIVSEKIYRLGERRE
jgi:UDP-N-acetyl-D-glucosamine dehydrogenase